ncbi:MAG: class I SAM-dependent methyltransferase [Microthrixaceae bacterium]
MAGERTDDLAAWDEVADAYAAQPNTDWFDGFVDRHLGDVSGRRVLDLGCGHGWFTDQLRQRGADVVGVDGSTRLLEIARSAYPNTAFRQVDLRDGIDGEFDVVVALMVLMDVPDLSVIRPVVAPGGVLVATILHPSFFLQKTIDDEQGGYRQVRNYLDEEAWWIEGFGGHWHYHRPLGAYVDWLGSIGLGLVELFEPSPTVYDGWRARIPTRAGLAARPTETTR